MIQFTIENGSRQVVVTEQDGRYAARLYVNGGETATTTCWKGKTPRGARRWAMQVLGMRSASPIYHEDNRDEARSMGLTAL